jgi:hypothetical protein
VSIVPATLKGGRRDKLKDLKPLVTVLDMVRTMMKEGKNKNNE